MFKNEIKINPISLISRVFFGVGVKIRGPCKDKDDPHAENADPEHELVSSLAQMAQPVQHVAEEQGKTRSKGNGQQGGCGKNGCGILAFGKPFHCRRIDNAPGAPAEPHQKTDPEKGAEPGEKNQQAQQGQGDDLGGNKFVLQAQKIKGAQKEIGTDGTGIDKADKKTGSRIIFDSKVLGGVIGIKGDCRENDIMVQVTHQVFDQVSIGGYFPNGFPGMPEK